MTARRNGTGAGAVSLDLVRRRRERDGRDRLLLRNVPLAHTLAARYAGLGGCDDDLLTVAVLGLVTAADAYDPALEEPFVDHAEPIIAGELEHWLRCGGPAVAAVDDESAWRRAIAEAERTLHAALRRQDHVRALAGYLGCAVDDLVAGLMAAVERDADLLHVDVPDRDGQPA